MPPMQHTPLRRVSQGSLRQSANAAHHANSPSPTGLDFLPIHDLVDEIETLNQNLEVMERLTSSLAKFNEGFAMYSYGLRMSAFSVEWSEAPDETTWERVALEEEREKQHQGKSDQPFGGFGEKADRLLDFGCDQPSWTLKQQRRRVFNLRQRPTRQTGTAPTRPTRRTTRSTPLRQTRTRSGLRSSEVTREGGASREDAVEARRQEYQSRKGSNAKSVIRFHRFNLDIVWSC